MINEYGSASAASSKPKPSESDSDEPKLKQGDASTTKEPKEKQKGGKLTLDEERETGEVAWATYSHYLRAIGTWWWSVVIFTTLIAVEGSRATNSLFLGFWSSDRFANFNTGQYMDIYAGAYISTSFPCLRLTEGKDSLEPSLCPR